MAQSTPAPRKAVKLSKSLHRELSFYALAAGAGLLAASQPADAQIVFTPANETLGPYQRILLDFNHDGLTDLVIRELPYEQSFLKGHSVRVLPHSGGGVKQGYANGFAQPMSLGSRIGPGEEFLQHWGIIAKTYGIYYAGSWDDLSDHYLGVRFLIDGKLHYGWARLNVSGYGIFVTLTGYAYETRPGVPIDAGQTGSEEGGDAGNDSSLPRSGTKGTLGSLALGVGGVSR